MSDNQLCSDLNLLLNPTKTQAMMFSTQHVKPNTPALFLNGTDITMCDKVSYLGTTIDDKLCFQEHAQSVLTTQPRKGCILLKVLCTSVQSLFLIFYLKVSL